MNKHAERLGIESLAEFVQQLTIKDKNHPLHMWMALLFLLLVVDN